MSVLRRTFRIQIFEISLTQGCMPFLLASLRAIYVITMCHYPATHPSLSYANSSTVHPYRGFLFLLYLNLCLTAACGDSGLSFKNHEYADGQLIFECLDF